VGSRGLTAQRIAAVSLAVGVALVAAKTIVGLGTGSLAVLSGGRARSIGDVLTRLRVRWTPPSAGRGTTYLVAPTRRR
jgi:divalent metal cation (Fe/Co/Zn/Cd) transporter